MAKPFAIAILFCTLAGLARAQSKEETMDYIVRELQAAESEGYVVKEVAFSEGGSVLSYRTLITGNQERKLVIYLKDVNVFYKRLNTIKDNPEIKRNQDLDYCDLLVESRAGKKGFRINGSAVEYPKKILENILNERKVKSLEKAFGHLIALISGRKEPFPV
jgi:shikimate kinase